MCYSLTGFLLPFYLQDILHLSPTKVGLLFMAPSILTVALAPLSGYLADRLGPRIPATVGVVFMVISLGIGGLLRVDSHWLLPTLLVVVGAITNGVFNPANSTAMIAMMPKEHRGFASAINHVTFGFGSVFGVALGGLCMSLAFEQYTGVKTTSLTTDNAQGFVAALNLTFVAAIVLTLVAIATSAMRGSEKPPNTRLQLSRLPVSKWQTERNATECSANGTRVVIELGSRNNPVGLTRRTRRRDLMTEKIIYLNGAFVAESEAKVSVLDSGFNAGDGVYDVTRTFAHRPFRLRDHTARLFRSLRYTRIDCGLTLEQMEAATLEVLERNRPSLGKDDEVAIWQVVSRGMRTSRGNHALGKATVAIYCITIGFEEFARDYLDGVKLVIPSTRRIPPQCLEPKAKINNKMNHNMAIFEARQVDPHAIPLMLDLDGNISESNAHNFFLVLDGKLCTPSNKNVLDGITKQALYELAANLEIEVVDGNFTPYDAYNAEEAFLASTSPTILPVQSINGVRPTKETPGPITKRLIQGWNKMVGLDIVEQALGHLEPAERDRLRKEWRTKSAS